MGTSKQLCLAVAACVLDGRAYAFEFPEHAQFSADAIKYVTDDAPDADRAPLNGYLEQVRIAIDPGKIYLCKDAFPSGEYDAWPKTCLTGPDITGLAGDLASSPQNLLFRAFDPEAAPKPGTKATAAQRLASYLQAAGRSLWPRSAETTFTRPLDPVNTLPDLRQSMKRGSTDKCLNAFKDWNSAEATGTGGVFAGLAVNNQGHFRPQRSLHFSGAQAAAASARKTREAHTELNAFAYYADLHLGALAFASKGYPGLAVYQELYALHYLQDAVAPGHISAAVDAKQRLKDHKAGNANGATIQLSDALCSLVRKKTGRFPGLESACNQHTTDRHIRVYGDGRSYCYPDNVPGNPNVTREYATLVSYISFSQVAEALLRPSAVPAAITNALIIPPNEAWPSAGEKTCWPVLFHGRQVDPPANLKDTVRLLCGWWEPSTPASRENLFIDSTVGNQLHALDFVP